MIKTYKKIEKNQVQNIYVISIKQPWAQLIIDEKKSIEIRTWTTDYRGELYIHTGRNPDKVGLKLFNYNKSRLFYGALIGKCILTDIIIYKNKEDFINDRDKHLNLPKWYRSPLFGFVLKHCQKITPIYMKGKLGVFQYNLHREMNKNNNKKNKKFTLLDYF